LREDKMKRNKLIQINTILFVFLVAIALVSNTTISQNINFIKNSKNLNIEKTYNKISNALAPNKGDFIFEESSLRDNPKSLSQPLDCTYMYGYRADTEPECIVYFPIDDPSEINELCPSQSDNLLSGGTYGGLGYWYACENSTGALWQIDPYWGEMEYIGGGGVGLNSLAYDHYHYTMYGGSGSDLYEIDFYDGSQEYVGSFGNNINEMIGISFDADGILYGWDLEYDTLWTIDTETGEATEIGSLGIDLNNAQDGDFDCEIDTLYLTAFTDKGQLYECDKETGECTIIGDFEENSQITASFITFRPTPYFDIGITKIVKPNDGYANNEMEVIVKVKNYGLSLYDTPVNVKIIKEENIIEYNETVYIEEIHYNEELEINFPTWTPDDWQEKFNKTYNYNITTYVSTWPDTDPNNNYKEKSFELYFPLLHDIEIKEISPNKDGPGKTYPVNTTIKNVGQSTESNISIDIDIFETIVNKTFINESSWEQVPPLGWNDEHKDVYSYYGWRKSYSSRSGGTYPEIELWNNFAISGCKFYSCAIDTSEYSDIHLRFKSYIHHSYGEGIYSLNAGYSFDKETWITTWHEKPNSSSIYNIDLPIELGSNTTYIGFWFEGDSDYFYKWYIDNVKLEAVSYNEEYSDFAYHETDIEPGDEIIITFDDWTPDYLENETTNSKNYMVKTIISMENDENPENDKNYNYYELSYWHDVGIDKILSPCGEPCKEGKELLWDNGEPDGRNYLPSCLYQNYSNILIDDFENLDKIMRITGGKVHIIWNSGYTSNLEKIVFYIYESEERCDASLVEYTSVDASTFDEYTTGNYYFGRPEIIIDFILDEDIKMEDSNWYVGIQLVGVIEDIGYILTSENNRCEVLADLPIWDYERWTNSEDIWEEEYDLAWQLHGSIAACYPPRAWIKPGLQDINVLLKNLGTFPEKNITCYSKIREYANDPEWGTKVHTDKIDNITLSNPLGGEIEIQFDDYNFSEGIYRLFIDLPRSNDNFQDNNKMKLKIYSDGTSPISNYPPILDPSEPSGNNGWYNDSVIVTLNATDPIVNGFKSGVEQIQYSINGGVEKTIIGNIGSFVLDDEGENVIIEYYAIDYSGNYEFPKKSFEIKIDHTVPEVSLTYDVVGGNKWLGWDFEFTAVANDDISKMEKVEFYLNNELQETVEGSGPEYVWTIKYWPLEHAIFSATAYDNAGNTNSDEIIDPENSPYSKQEIYKKINNNRCSHWFLYIRENKTS
jgi:hypothetical protein